MSSKHIKFDKILIVQYNMLGDVILSTGIVKAVRDQFPNSKIAYLVSPETADLVRLPFIDELVVYDKGMPLLPVIKQIWRYDVAILLDFKYRSAVVPFLAMIPVRAGLRHKRGLFMTHAIDLPNYNYKLYITKYLAQIIEDSIGLKLTHDVTRLYVADATEQDIEKVDSLLGPLDNDAMLIAISPFTSMEVKDWPMEYYKEFMECLKTRYKCQFIILGSSDDRKNDFFLFPDSIDLRGRTSMTELAEVLRRANYFIGGCSAPLHLASAVGTPALALYGPTSAVKWAPIHGCICLQHVFSCSPCDRWYGRDCGGDNKCMKSITVEEALQGFERLCNEYPVGK